MQVDSSGLATFTCLYVLIKRVKLLTEKRTLKALFFSRKQRKSESLAKVQFVIDSCRLVSQSNYLSNSNKDCDWLILVCFIRDRKNFRIPILGLKGGNNRDFKGIFLGKPKIGKVLPTPFMDQENPILIPPTGFVCPNFYPRMGVSCTILSPTLGFNIPIPVPTMEFFGPRSYPKVGFFCIIGVLCSTYRHLSQRQILIVCQ